MCVLGVRLSVLVAELTLALSEATVLADVETGFFSSLKHPLCVSTVWDMRVSWHSHPAAGFSPSRSNSFPSSSGLLIQLL